jgi:hypothetical protein
MESEKITSIKVSNITRNSRLKSTFDDLLQIPDLLNKVRIAAQDAPLINMIKYEGTPRKIKFEKKWLIPIPNAISIWYLR